MEFRTFAKSDEKISRLGFGAWGIGKTMWIGADDDESRKVLQKAVDSGVNFFDSALVYGMGHSEKLLGELEKEVSQDLFITSKIPPRNNQWPMPDEAKADEAFPKNHILLSTERSLRNLKRDHIDLQQFHVWNDNWADNDEWKEATYRLKKEGKVRYFGISINDHQPENSLQTAATGFIDSFQVIFNIFEQAPIDKLFPFCEENNISIIARVPFDEGALTGSVRPDTIFPEQDFRNQYFRGDRKEQVWEKVQEIQSAAGGETDSLAEAALRFISGFKAVTTIIPGMRKKKNLLSNLESINKGPLSTELMEKLKEFRWDKNYWK